MWKYRCEAFTLKNRRCKKNKSDDHFCSIHKEKPIIEPELCSICYDEVNDKTILDCNHSFCKKCIYTWLCKCTGEFNCPMCRKYITDVSLKYSAWKFGEDTKLLIRSVLTIYKTDILPIDHYELIKDTLDMFFDREINQELFFLLEIIVNNDLKIIFNKILQTATTFEKLIQFNPCLHGSKKIINTFYIHSY